MTQMEFGEYRTVTFEVDSASGTVSKYDAVRLTGEGAVSLTNGTGQNILGIAAKDETGDFDGTRRVSVNLSSIRNANVGTGAAGAFLVTSSTAGQLREVNTDGATGETPTPGGTFKLVRSADADGLGQVFIR